MSENVQQALFDVAAAPRHPARFSDPLIAAFATHLPRDRYPLVLDPFSGAGGIHALPNRTVGVELEPEWAALHPDTVVGDARNLPFDDATFAAVCTSAPP